MLKAGGASGNGRPYYFGIVFCITAIINSITFIARTNKSLFSFFLLLIKIFWATWRSRALNLQPIAHPTPNVSDAARTVVDATTGAVTRYVAIERDDDPAHLAELLRTLYGDVEA